MSDRMDELAKSMASGGLSRRRALGSALAALFGVGGLSAMSAAPSGDTCARYCRTYYKGLQRAACLLNCMVQSNNNPF